jgi:hypothetical protein
MSSWNFFDYACRDNLLEAVGEQSDAFLGLVGAAGAWEAPTAAGHWEVRDVVGHLVDTTEGYFAGFETARSSGTAPEPLGVRGMNEHVDKGALAFRGTSQDELVSRLRTDRAQMIALATELRDRVGTINGIVHAAGVVAGPSFALLRDLRPADCLSSQRLPR